jgi:hypothetical protein
MLFHLSIFRCVWSVELEMQHNPAANWDVSLTTRTFYHSTTDSQAIFDHGDGNNSHLYHNNNPKLQPLRQNIPIPPPLLPMQARSLLQPLMSISRMEGWSSSGMSQIIEKDSYYYVE